MSSCRLIKDEDALLYRIDSFEVEDLDLRQDDEPLGKENPSVCLPVGPASPGRSVLDRFAEKASEEGGAPEEDFKERLAVLEREAFEKGFEQGRRDGLELEKRQLAEKGKQFESLCAELADLKERIYRESEEELLKLSLLIAKRIIREEVGTDSGLIVRSIRAAFKLLTDASQIRILISPDDMGEVKKIISDLSVLENGGRFEVVEEAGLSRGGCVLETGFGRINATIDDQLAMLEKEILETFEASHPEET